MHFREALIQVCEDPIPENGALQTYSRLNDLCGNDYADQQKIRTFYQIDQRLSVAYRLQKDGEKAKEELLNEHSEVADLLDETVYQKMIVAVSEAILEKKADPPTAAKPTPVTVSVKKAGKRKTPTPNPPKPTAKRGKAANPQKAIVVPSPTPPPPAQKTPLSPQSSNPLISNGQSVGAFDVILFIGYLIGLGILYRFAASAELAVWAKWLIGAGTVIVTGVLFLIIDDSEGVASPIAGGVLLFANMIFLIAFDKNGTFLSVCISSVLILIFSISVHRLSCDEEILACVSLMELFAAVVELGVAISFPIVMQWVLGVVFAVVFVFAIIVTYDSYVFECGLPAFSALICLIANLVLLLVFRENYRIVSCWIAATCTAQSAFHIWYCFDECEEEFGIFAIANCIFGIVSFILSILPIFS